MFNGCTHTLPPTHTHPHPHTHTLLTPTHTPTHTHPTYTQPHTPPHTHTPHPPTHTHPTPPHTPHTHPTHTPHPPTHKQSKCNLVHGIMNVNQLYHSQRHVLKFMESNFNFYILWKYVLFVFVLYKL